MPKGFLTGKSRQREPALHNPNASENNTATCRPPAFHRLRITNQQVQKKQAPPTTTPMDLKNAVPPVKAISPLATANLDENLIGIALGSPRLVESQMYSHMRNDSYPSTAVHQRAGLGKSRWRRIGGLFKTKRTPAASQPFYQLRVNNDWPLQKPTYSIGVEDEKSKAEVQGDNPPDEWPRFRQQKEDHGSHDSQAKTKTKENTRPLLEVDIPNVQMERYSVMFSGTLSKTGMDMTEDTAPELSDLPPPLRPTSSPRPKSPSFTLFPTTHSSRLSKGLSTHNLPGPSPLTITQTAPEDQNSGRERSLWHSPTERPDSRRRPSDSSSATIDLNVDGPPLQSSKHAPPNTPNPDLEISSPPETPLSTTTTPTHSKSNTKTKDSSIPKIEISVARSVSVSRGTNKQTLIPIRQTECLDADERLVERQRAKTPTVMDGKYGHKHGNSQVVKIEGA